MHERDARTKELGSCRRRYGCISHTAKVGNTIVAVCKTIWCKTSCWLVRVLNRASLTLFPTSPLRPRPRHRSHRRRRRRRWLAASRSFFFPSSSLPTPQRPLSTANPPPPPPARAPFSLFPGCRSTARAGKSPSCARAHGHESAAAYVTRGIC